MVKTLGLGGEVGCQARRFLPEFQRLLEPRLLGSRRGPIHQTRKPVHRLSCIVLFESQADSFRERIHRPVETQIVDNYRPSRVGTVSALIVFDGRA